MPKKHHPIIINRKVYIQDDRMNAFRYLRDSKERIPIDALDEYKFWFDQMAHLVGKTIKYCDLEYDDDVSAWYPYLGLNDGTRVYLTSDEEGNSGGRFQIESESLKS